MIATTNNIWALDETLANRPGRFDLKVRIGNPHPHVVRKITGKKYSRPIRHSPIHYIG